VPVIRGEQIELEVATRFVIDVLPVQPNAQAQVVSTVGMLSSVSLPFNPSRCSEDRLRPFVKRTGP
jgi:hypothetical protein